MKLVLATAMVALAAAGAAAAAGRDVGDSLVFTRFDDTGLPHTIVASPRGGRERELSLRYPAIRPVWSPDGRSLVVSVFRPEAPIRPATMNADGSEFRVLDVAGIPPLSDVLCGAWSPTGRTLLCQVINVFGDNGADGAYTIRARDGSGATRLTVNPYPPVQSPGCCFGGGDIVGSFSPNGRQFVFMRARPGPDLAHPDDGQTGALFVENVDGTGLRQITPFGTANSHDNGVESWSPDGRWIVFADADFTLQLIRPDGTGLHAVPIPPDPAGRSFAFSPHWSPDGGRIVFGFFTPSRDRPDLFTVRPDGSRLTPVTDTPQFEDSPDWRGGED